MSTAPDASADRPNRIGKSAPLPVLGSVPLTGPTRGPTVVVSIAVTGDTAIDVAVSAWVVPAFGTVVDDASEVDVGASVVAGTAAVVGTIESVVGTTTRLGGVQFSTGVIDADAVESSERSRLRIVSVTVPRAGDGPPALQISVVPGAPIVL